MEWNSTYATGIPRIDEQHQKLFSILKSLQKALKAGNGSTLVIKTIKDLVDYFFY